MAENRRLLIWSSKDGWKNALRLNHTKNFTVLPFVCDRHPLTARHSFMLTLMLNSKRAEGYVTDYLGGKRCLSSLVFDWTKCCGAYKTDMHSQNFFSVFPHNSAVQMLFSHPILRHTSAVLGSGQETVAIWHRWFVIHLNATKWVDASLVVTLGGKHDRHSSTSSFIAVPGHRQYRGEGGRG